MMRFLLQVLCVLPALIVTGYSLSCKVCVDTFGSLCIGKSKICSPDNVCMSSYTENTAAGNMETVLIRSCDSKSKCGMSGSISNHAVKSKMNTSCCTTDNCTPPRTTLSADSNIKNGVTCPNCNSADSDNCYTSDTIECTGDEKKCVLQTTTMTGSNSSIEALRGCATESICNTGTLSISHLGINTELKAKCSNGNIGLHQGFFFPAVALLLMKL
ncbi:phospholipase A2 inhibitor NAI-like [Ascaphus truei]|uniref:phospholipase A2 inhibitor NAI-like n=1 Tax=Ascaphus truei TaxID=8439 RepID=UPI003F5A2635